MYEILITLTLKVTINAKENRWTENGVKMKFSHFWKLQTNLDSCLWTDYAILYLYSW